ncbi:diploid state maintenance protein chpA [Phakopsora pachyrhizi]|uniref:Diploid state maintenance protein chpA n=1 Tax=Phakopsora pachyrhizi TaxID=170000 RepID=A0AAV0B109_PHAPC|nr:diploid state maintenance protein chpA [Phakopsora pachyrhizi]CAH7675000.1 diploid state maintenance protein chpA [Phakopsora pachyrhizi]
MVMICRRRGCGKEFDESKNEGSNCSFHPGQPVFHEGLKSWSCCKDLNRPVLEFDQFMRIEGCITGSHSTEQQQTPETTNCQKVEQQQQLPDTSDQFKNIRVTSHLTTSDVFRPIKTPKSSQNRTPANEQPKVQQVHEIDDEDSVVKLGSKCKRLGCKVEWKGESRRGKLNDQECSYHPGTPIFHEGSKGYSCCKRRVLDFDDFLEIKGCKNSSHLFLGSGAHQNREGQMVNCRFDFYQTPGQVIVSIFGKSAIKDLSFVKFEPMSFDVQLKLPENKLYIRRFELFGEIDPSKSSYKLLPTKCEIILSKADGRSWSNLEIGDTSGGTVTFGVSGRTGTIGAKDIVI